MDPQLKNALVAIGLVDINASDAQAAQAWAQYQQQNPAGAQQIMQQAGGSSQIPWLTVLGVVGGLVALYFVWQHYGGRRQVDAFEYPEEDADDARPRLHEMSESLGTFRSLASPKRSASCRGPRRMGKYEFEPESRLEGYRRKKR